MPTPIGPVGTASWWRLGKSEMTETTQGPSGYYGVSSARLGPIPWLYSASGRKLVGDRRGEIEGECQ